MEVLSGVGNGTHSLVALKAGEEIGVRYIYLGDGDGKGMCRSYAEKGATVLALDCHCANVAMPRLRYVSQKGSGSLYWVDRVSAKQPETWYEALKLVLGR